MGKCQHFHERYDTYSYISNTYCLCVFNKIVLLNPIWKAKHTFSTDPENWPLKINEKGSLTMTPHYNDKSRNLMFEQTNITKQKQKQRHPLELTVDSDTQRHLHNPHTGLCATCSSFYIYIVGHQCL